MGLLRLGTEGRPTEADAEVLIHLALDAGVRLLDTADVYSLGASDLHYGEQLARQAVASWHGPGDEVRILTKVGLSRPKGKWIPNGRPEHLRKAIDHSLSALGVERLFVWQLHAHDPRVPFEETLGALAEIQRAGKVEHLGLCNTTPGEVRQAQRHFEVALVQNELSLLNRKSAGDGMLELTRELGIPFLAHRPLGGYAKAARLAKNRVLKPIAERYGATPYQVALASLWDAGPQVIPLVGATRQVSLRSSLAAVGLRLDVSDRTALEMHYSFAPRPDVLAGMLPATPAAASTAAAIVSPLQTPPADGPEVVLLMGIQGAGKSQRVGEYLARGYARLNRDELGGTLDELVPRLVQLLHGGHHRVVLDNTYPTRLSRAPVIAAASAFGVPTRCFHLQTPVNEAHINLVLRMLARYGRPLGPEEMKHCGKTDRNLPPPAALARWLASYERPAMDEGFASVETLPFVRRGSLGGEEKGLLLDVDGTLRKTRSGEPYPRHPDDVEILPGRREVLAQWIAAGYKLFFVSNQSGVSSGKASRAAVEAAFFRTAELLALPVTEIAYCPHPAYPIGCYCRKPSPGLGVYLIERHRLSPAHTVMVGDMESDAEFAKGLGVRYVDHAAFFRGT